MRIDEAAESLLRLSGKDNYSCVALIAYGGEYLIASNKFVVRDDVIKAVFKTSNRIVNLGKSNETHAEMVIVGRLLAGVPADQVHRGMFSNLRIGISKPPCNYCAQVLDFLQIKHRRKADKYIDVGVWGAPSAIEKNDDFLSFFQTRDEQEDGNWK